MTDNLSQYRAVRDRVGLIDRSDTGKLAIVGRDRYTWLQGMVSNDVRLLEQGSPSLPSFILNATGHVLTDLALINIVGNAPLANALGLATADFVLLDLPRVNLQKIATLLDRYLIMEEAEIVDVTDRLACFSLQGPSVAAILPEVDPSSGIMKAEADHTGSGGIDLYFAKIDREAWLTELRSRHLEVIEAEAQEILRIEAGIPMYGMDMDETTIALETDLGPTHISLKKGCYMGQEIIARIDARGHTNRALTGLVFAEGEIPAPGDKLLTLPVEEDAEGRETGRITSVIAAAPAMESRPIALAYIRHEHRAPGARLLVGEAQRLATVVKLPFYRKP